MRYHRPPLLWRVRGLRAVAVGCAVLLGRCAVAVVVGVGARLPRARGFAPALRQRVEGRANISKKAESGKKSESSDAAGRFRFVRAIGLRI